LIFRKLRVLLNLKELLSVVFLTISVDNFVDIRVLFRVKEIGVVVIL